MAILEVGIVFKTTNLITKKFYNSDDVISAEHRNHLLQAVYNMATDIFNDSLQNFSFGEFVILIQSHPLRITDDEEEEEDEEHLLSLIPPFENEKSIEGETETPKMVDKNENKVQIYTLIEKNTNIKSVKKTMNEILLQFLNKYSIYDITEKNVKKFKKFSDRFAEVFQDLALNSEDRFKSIF